MFGVRGVMYDFLVFVCVFLQVWNLMSDLDLDPNSDFDSGLDLDPILDLDPHLNPDLDPNCDRDLYPDLVCRIHDLESAVDRMRQQQEHLQKKLKDEGDQKARLEVGHSLSGQSSRAPKCPRISELSENRKFQIQRNWSLSNFLKCCFVFLNFFLFMVMVNNYTEGI